MCMHALSYCPSEAVFYVVFVAFETVLIVSNGVIVPCDAIEGRLDCGDLASIECIHCRLRPICVTADKKKCICRNVLNCE